jgi:hypothetical protein
MTKRELWLKNMVFLFFVTVFAFGFCDLFWTLFHGQYRAVLDGTMAIVGYGGILIFSGV